MSPEIETTEHQSKAIRDYLDSRPQTKRIGVQPGMVWNADGEAVYLRALMASGFLLCSDTMAHELSDRQLIDLESRDELKIIAGTD